MWSVRLEASPTPPSHPPTSRPPGEQEGPGAAPAGAGRLEVPVRLQAVLPPTTTTLAHPPAGCREQGKRMPLTVQDTLDRNLVARMTARVFRCVVAEAGFDRHPPTSLRRWDGASRWGFQNLADQVAAEAVVVAYCESKGFDPHSLSADNPWGYGGLFQMGTAEMRRFGAPGASKFDPVDNAHAAATYFVWIHRRGGGWGGWSPWAVVNTNFSDEVNDQVKVPVLPRFASTDPEHSGRRGPDLPTWAADPWSWEVPAFDGCPFTGGSWPPSRPLPPEPPRLPLS